MSDYRWSEGTLIGLPFLVLTIIFLIWLAWWFIRKSRTARDSIDRTPLRVLSVVSAGLAGLFVVGTLLGMWPYKAEYHQWRETSGVVAEIDSRLLSSGSGNGVSQRFVVTFEDGAQRSCDDTRCAQVEEGDELVLTCKREWQWAGSHGYNCNYVSHHTT